MGSCKRKPPVVRHVLTEEQITKAALHLGGTGHAVGERVLSMR